MNLRKILQGLFSAAAAGLSPVLFASSAAEHIEVGGGTLDVFIDSDQFEAGRTALLDWVKRSAGAVIAYFGRFPVARARVHIIISPGRACFKWNEFRRSRGARCKISVGRHTTMSHLYNDWEAHA